MRLVLMVLLVLVVGCRSDSEVDVDRSKMNGSYRVLAVHLDRCEFQVVTERIDNSERLVFGVYTGRTTDAKLNAKVPVAGEVWRVEWSSQLRRYEFIEKESK